MPGNSSFLFTMLRQHECLQGPDAQDDDAQGDAVPAEGREGVLPGPYRVAKLRIFRERHPYGRPGADLTLQINFGIVQQGNVLDDGKP